MVTMPASDRGSGIREIGYQAAVRELERKVTRFERIYEMSSEKMLEALESGERQDTAEVVQWMVLYQTLKHLTA